MSLHRDHSQPPPRTLDQGQEGASKPSKLKDMPKSPPNSKVTPPWTSVLPAVLTPDRGRVDSQRWSVGDQGVTASFRVGKAVRKRIVLTFHNPILAKFIRSKARTWNILIGQAPLCRPMFYIVVWTSMSYKIFNLRIKGLDHS